MKITDVVTLMEFGAFGTPGSRAMGTGNFALLHRAYVNKRPRLSRNLQLNFGNDQIVELDDEDIEAVANYYDSLPTDQDRYSFVYDVMSRGDKFNSLLQKLGRRTGTAQQPNLLERDSKKNSDSGLDRNTVRSAELNRTLKQAYARYPNAASDIEALMMHDMDVQKNTSQELQAQARTNQRQDDIDTQMRDVARKQSNKISSLDQENDSLTAELDKLSRELDALGNQADNPKDTAKDNDKSEKNTQPDAVVARGNDERSDKRGQSQDRRAADAEKRTAEPARLKTGSATFKPLGSTLPMVPPTKPAMPTIDVIDEPNTSPAVDQMAQQLTSPVKPQTDITLPTSLKADPEEFATDLSQPDLFGEPQPTPADRPIPTKMAAVDAEEEPPLPPNVTDLSKHRRTIDQLRKSSADQARNTIKTGTFESQELRRMRELAGLSQ
jgi:hypothetical protein